MSIEAVKTDLEHWQLAGRIREFSSSSATVELAAQALGCEPRRIAKTLSFRAGESCILIVAAGDAKIDNARFKAQFGLKASMLTPEEAVRMTGHAIGGICPFALPDGMIVYLDESLRRFCTVFPACGSSNSAIELTIEELERVVRHYTWVDVCKGWQVL
jgi:prolyl-tRNA editing enzyme YbaK/EbsC (Cys-tRNA(Pro) deacylase)